MSNKPREWPNVAAEARDRAAEYASEGIRLMEPLVTGEREFTETERIRIFSRALNLFQRIVRLLESVGAKTRPF